jgi:hypothetical protein
MSVSTQVLPSSCTFICIVAFLCNELTPPAMDLKRSEDDRTNNRRDDIAIWQTKTLAFKNDEAHTTGVIALLYDALVIIHGIKHGNSEPQYFRSLEESAATLVFWGGDHDVSRGALDKILQHAQHLRDAVLLTLVSIGDLLSQSACI